MFVSDLRKYLSQREDNRLSNSEPLFWLSATSGMSVERGNGTDAEACKAATRRSAVESSLMTFLYVNDPVAMITSLQRIRSRDEYCICIS